MPKIERGVAIATEGDIRHIPGVAEQQFALLILQQRVQAAHPEINFFNGKKFREEE